MASKAGKRLAVVTPKPSKALAVVAESQTPMSVFERLAKDPTLDVGKLTILVGLQKEILALQAKAAFTVAFAKMQGALPVVTKRGQIKNRQGAVQSRYAKLEDIQTAVKPVLQAHGFTLRHRTEWPTPGLIRIVGILVHTDGHTEESAFEAPMDSSDYRSAIQSQGSTVSYGRRYTTIDLLNITQQGIDDDGQSGGKKAEVYTLSPAQAKEPITEGQLKRLYAIAKSSGRPETEIKMWLKVRYDLDSSKMITKGLYDAIVTAIEQPGPLPLPEVDHA